MWLLAPLLPLLNLAVLPMGDFVHDRYLYLPSIGFALLAAAALKNLRWERAERWGMPALAPGVLLLVAAAYSAGTVVQSRHWRDDLALYRRGMEIAPRHDVPPRKLASTLIRLGRYEEGIEAYRRVLAYDPDFWWSNYEMGVAHYMLRRYREAEGYLEKSARLKPTPESQYYLGLSRWKQGRLPEAEENLRAAVAGAPRVSTYQGSLGLLFKERKNLPQALKHLRAAAAANPQDAAALGALAEIEQELAAEKGAR
jgi:tetratricopeptide (TPR) repeat protein